MFFRLNDVIALRRWAGTGYAYYIKGVPLAEKLTEEEFQTLLLCNGEEEVPPSELRDDLVRKRLIRPCAFGNQPREWSRFRQYDNRYFPRMNLMITGKCNYNCRHCFNAADQAPLMSEWKVEEVSALLDQAEDCGVHAFTITGGEPMLHPRFMDILKDIHRRSMFVEELNTNGSFITEELLEEMKSFGCKPLMKISFDALGFHDWMLSGFDPSACGMTEKAGGIAGLICTLCRYEEFYGDRSIQRLIRILADRLSALRTLSCEGRLLWKTLPFTEHPISGAVHGMTGIWEAFVLAGRILGTDRYAGDAEEAFSFETAAYNGKQGEWMDLRIPGNNKPARGNCYGAEGIGIILNRMRKTAAATEQIRENAARADRAVRRHPAFPLDHLCCGSMSAVEYYLENGDHDAAGVKLAEVLQAKKENGVYRLGAAGYVPNNNVTLFFGLAGIGYELLRYTDPDAFPPVV